MNSTSLLIVIVLTAFGAIGMYFGIQYGMDASDDYAQRLSVNSKEYLLFREKALAQGEDPTKIQQNASRSQKPASYDGSLAVDITSPFFRPDSDTSQLFAGANNSLTLSDESDITALFTKKLEDEAGRRLTPKERRLLAKILAEEKQQLPSDDEIVISVDEGREQEALFREGVGEEIDMELILSKLNDEDYTYTVSDEIRRQLAEEDMSDEKRAQLEAVLPKEAAKPVRAVDVRLKFDTDACVVPRNSNSWIGVLFRNESAAIRGSSLNELDDLIVLRDRCDGTLTIEDFAGALGKTDRELRESRRDEVKYYLLQRRVPKEFIEISTL